MTSTEKFQRFCTRDSLVTDIQSVYDKRKTAVFFPSARPPTKGAHFAPRKFRHAWDILRTSTEKFRQFFTRDSLDTDIQSVYDKRKTAVFFPSARPPTNGAHFAPRKFRHAWDILRTSTEKFRRFITRDSLVTDIQSVYDKRKTAVFFPRARPPTEGAHFAPKNSGMLGTS